MANKRLKIVFLSFYSGKVARGAETFVHELANRLALNNDVVVCQAGSALRNAKYQTKTFKSDSLYLFTKKTLNSIGNTDILFPVNGRIQGILCKLWAIKHGAKLVFSGQSGPGADDRLNLWTFPDLFLALTDFQYKWAKKVNPLVKIAKIPNGTDINRFGKDVDPIKIDLPKPIILCVAAYSKSKRLELAIKAVSKLKKGSLFLVGKGEEENNLRSLGDKLLPGRFKMEYHPYADIAKVYPAGDLFTFPTVEWESFGIVMVEAMASGLPVVATNDPMRKEIVGDAGVLVDPTDSAEYAKAIKKALDKNWGSIPRHQAEKFNWDKIAESYEKLFFDLKDK